jgi:cation diffusion facilitator family transporter
MQRSGKDEERAGASTLEVESDAPWGLAERRAGKETAAAVSLVVVLLLGIAKLVAGLLSGSLGLVADAIHSGLDFVSALLTVLAVRWADRPADADHPYGHGRGENVAAFVEALLLVGTAVWIGGEAIDRILVGGQEVNPGPLSFIVMLVSMGVSYWRSREMRREAEAHSSAALEAGALNFSADVYSSLVVLAGLVIVAGARALGAPSIFASADAVAGLLVAVLVIASAGSLIRETIDALVDRSPESLVDRISEAVAKVPGVIDCRRVRLRRVGNCYFVDVVAVAARTTNLLEARELVKQIEAAIHQVEPRTDVVVDLQPGIDRAETIVDRIHLLANEVGVRVHDIKVQRVGGKLEVNLHVEVSPSLTLERAHDLASELENRIEVAEPSVRSVNTHVEVEPPDLGRRVDVTGREPDLVDQITAVADRVLGPGHGHDVRVFRPGGANGPTDVVLHLAFPPSTPITDAHVAAENLERALRDQFPGFASVLVHVEPAEGDKADSPKGS